MKRTTRQKLIGSSNAIEHYLVKHRIIRADDLGMGELTTAGIVISFTVFLGIFVGSAVMLGGF